MVGFFDSLLGLSTAKAQGKAAAQANALTNSTTGVTNQILQDAVTGAKGDVTNYGQQARDALTGGVNQGVGTVLGSNGLFQPYVDAGTAATKLYGGALGLGGQAGHDAAVSAFHTSPGYEWSVDQATDAVARKAASLGMAASGNTLDAVTRLAGNLADQQYGGFLDRLSGLGSQGLTAAGQMAGNDRTAGTMQYGGAGTLASLLNGQGTTLGSLDANLGTALTNNAWKATGAVDDVNAANAKAQDAATSTNNGIFGNLISGGLNLLGGTASGSALKTAFNKF